MYQLKQLQLELIYGYQQSSRNFLTNSIKKKYVSHWWQKLKNICKYLLLNLVLSKMRYYICKCRSESICFAAFSGPEAHMNRPRCPDYSTLNVDWHAAKIRPKQIDRFLLLWWACMIKHSSPTVWRNNFNECVSFSKCYIFDPRGGKLWISGRDPHHNNGFYYFFVQWLH